LFLPKGIEQPFNLSKNTTQAEAKSGVLNFLQLKSDKKQRN